MMDDDSEPLAWNMIKTDDMQVCECSREEDGCALTATPGWLYPGCTLTGTPGGLSTSKKCMRVNCGSGMCMRVACVCGLCMRVSCVCSMCMCMRVECVCVCVCVACACMWSVGVAREVGCRLYVHRSYLYMAGTWRETIPIPHSGQFCCRRQVFEITEKKLNVSLVRACALYPPEAFPRLLRVPQRGFCGCLSPRHRDPHSTTLFTHRTVTLIYVIHISGAGRCSSQS